MFHLPRHKRIRVLLEALQTGVGTEVDSLAVIIRTAIIRWVFEQASTGSFVFGQWGEDGFSQNSVFLIFPFFTQKPISMNFGFYQRSLP